MTVEQFAAILLAGVDDAMGWIGAGAAAGAILLVLGIGIRQGIKWVRGVGEGDFSYDDDPHGLGSERGEIDFWNRDYGRAIDSHDGSSHDDAAGWADDRARDRETLRNL